jgi:hypothetical protein
MIEVVEPQEEEQQEQEQEVANFWRIYDERL